MTAKCAKCGCEVVATYVWWYCDRCLITIMYEYSERELIRLIEINAHQDLVDDVVRILEKYRALAACGTFGNHEKKIDAI